MFGSAGSVVASAAASFSSSEHFPFDTVDRHQREKLDNDYCLTHNNNVYTWGNGKTTPQLHVCYAVSLGFPLLTALSTSLLAAPC